MLYNKSRLILSKSAFQMASESPYLMYQMANELEQSYLTDTEYLDADYLDQFHNVMTGDLCPDLVDKTGYFGNNVTTCRNFTYGISEQGLNLMMINLIRIMRLQLSQSQLNFTNQTYLNTFLNQNETFDICKLLPDFPSLPSLKNLYLVFDYIEPKESCFQIIVF